MTRVMLDALYPLKIPVPQDPAVIIAAYVGHAGNPDSYAQAVARFPGHQIVSIASHNAVDAQVLDVERGAVEPSDYVTMRTWILRQQTRGVFPTIYCNVSTWPTIPADIRGAVNWWAARWSADQSLPPGACGLQWDGRPGYDISTMLDYIPGIDPPTAGPAGHGSQIEDDMFNDTDRAALARLDAALGSPGGDLWDAIARCDVAAGIIGVEAGNGTQINIQPLMDRLNALPGEVRASIGAALVVPAANA